MLFQILDTNSKISPNFKKIMKNYFIISVYILVNFSLRLTATDLYLNLMDSEWWPKIGNKRDGLEPP